MNENTTSFSASEWLRYTRHIQLRKWAPLDN